jgi:hypothetical protein
MGCRKLSVQLEWASTAPTVARHLIAGWLDGMGHSERACRDAALVVSELVSAAINDRVGPPVLDAEIWHDALIVWVTNGKAIDLAPADDFGDLNAMVLSALCDDWGVDAAAASTRQWASLALT